MGADWGDGYQGRIDQQSGDIQAGLDPRTFNRDGSIATQAQPKAGSTSGGLDWSSLMNTQAPDLNSVNPNTDLSYNSFLRGMGLNQAQIGAQKTRQNAYLDQQLNDQRPLWADQLRNGLRNISDNAESRGMFASGQRLQDQNQYQANQNQQQLAYENGIHRQQGENDATAQGQLLDLARQRADQELAARQRVATTQLQDQTNPVLTQFLLNALQGS